MNELNLSAFSWVEDEEGRKTWNNIQTPLYKKKNDMLFGDGIEQLENKCLRNLLSPNNNRAGLIPSHRNVNKETKEKKKQLDSFVIINKNNNNINHICDNKENIINLRKEDAKSKIKLKEQKSLLNTTVNNNNNNINNNNNTFLIQPDRVLNHKIVEPKNPSSLIPYLTAKEEPKLTNNNLPNNNNNQQLQPVVQIELTKEDKTMSESIASIALVEQPPPLPPQESIPSQLVFRLFEEKEKRFWKRFTNDFENLFQFIQMYSTNNNE
ncbi:hypothetical protein ABK040_005625 [Willaertia magna]